MEIIRINGQNQKKIEFAQSTRPFNEYSSRTQAQILEALALGETQAPTHRVFQRIFDEFENIHSEIPNHVLQNVSFWIIKDWVDSSTIASSINQRRAHHRVNESVQVNPTSYI